MKPIRAFRGEARYGDAMSAIPVSGDRLGPGMKVFLRYAGAVAIVVLTCAAADIFSRLTGTARLTSIFLSCVLVVAFYLGRGPGYLAAVLALFAHLYMVDPPYHFRLGSLDEFNGLSLFLAASTLTCLLAGKIREAAAAARSRIMTSDALLAATREFSGTADEGYIRERLASRLCGLSGGDALVREGLRLDVAGEAGVDAEALRLATLVERGVQPGGAQTTREGDWTFRPLTAGDQRFGVAGWRLPRGRALSREAEAALELLTDTGAAAIARARLTAAKAEAETRARTEDLRNALLSSISHDLRTPLSAIIASAGSLTRFADKFDVETRRDLAATIEEEAERLDAFVSNLLQMTRLQSGAVPLKQVSFGAPEIIRRVLERKGANRGPLFTFESEPRLPDALGDPTLFEQAFGNVVENALRYAASGGEIVVSARRGDQRLIVEVADHGPGVAEELMETIFEKFFRGAPSEKVAGTGLGLAITRGLLEGMGGAVRARARDDGGSGLIVELSMPAVNP